MWHHILVNHMLHLRFISALAIVLFVCACHGQNIPRLSDAVKTEAGYVAGTSANGVRIYKGVPYAAPPINDLRWKAPQPVKPWRDTLACNAFPPSPIQNDPKPFRMWSQEFITPATPLSEDCLYLNIWTTARVQQEELPVLVWIHGGAFVSGSGACPIYDGEAMAKEGIVYVTINYRLGVFGFMAHPELTLESPHKSSGNYGLLDQLAALKWVKNNIAKFGGDPARVTIAGQSAGSMAVQALVASPLAKGLFQQAIAQSGAITNRPAPILHDAEETGTILAQKLKTPTLHALRLLPADSILALANTLPFGSFFPIADGHVLPADPKALFTARQHNDVTLMAGWVTGDADLVMGQPRLADDFRAFAASSYGSRSTEFLSLFSAQTDEAAKESQQKLAMIQFAGFPDRQWAIANKHKSYLYQFSYVPTDKPGFPNYGAFHSAEIPFALHTLKQWNRPWKPEDYAVEKYMSQYWVNFIKQGNPNGNALPEWKAYTSSEGYIMELGRQPVLMPALFKREFEFMSAVQK